MTPDPSQSGNAIYFDGRSNRRRPVTLRCGDGLQIVEAGEAAVTWPYAAVRRADAPRNMLRLRCQAALPLARLEIADPALQRVVLARCGALDADGGRTHTGRIVGWSLAAACSIVLCAIFLIPLVADRMAPLIPPALEKRMGDAVDVNMRAIFGGNACTGATGQAAFSRLVDRLRQAGDIDAPLQAHVLPSSVPNAFALPGGRVYLLDGLLQKADSADEIAGVLAHELGHVKHRDIMRKLLQTGGTSFLFGLLFGDVAGAGAVVFVSRSILDASYTREAEHNADAFAIDVMHKLGRSPVPMGQLLVRVVGDKEKALPTILASHPLSADRLAAMRQGDRPARGAELLSAAEWRALKDICRSPVDTR